jgi:hypothetical protein
MLSKFEPEHPVTGTLAGGRQFCYQFRPLGKSAVCEGLGNKYFQNIFYSSKILEGWKQKLHNRGKNTTPNRQNPSPALIKMRVSASPDERNERLLLAKTWRVRRGEPPFFNFGLPSSNSRNLNCGAKPFQQALKQLSTALRSKSVATEFVMKGNGKSAKRG